MRSHFLLLHDNVRKSEEIWSPADVLTCLWGFDYSQIITLFQDVARSTPVTADGDPIGGVSDLSGNSVHLAAAADAARPTYKTGVINSLSVARADGADDRLTFASPVAENNAVYFVMKTGIYKAAWNYFLQGQYSSDGIQFFRNNITRYRDNPEIIDFVGSSASTLYQFGFVRDNGNVTMYRNGDSWTDSDAGDGMDLWYLFAGSNDDLGEIWSYSTPPASADHDLIWAFLRSKWATY